MTCPDPTCAAAAWDHDHDANGVIVVDVRQQAGRPFVDLAHSGLLWLINASVFHPRGYALGLNVDADGNATGWELHGCGDRPWHFDDNLAETMMDAAWATLSDQAAKSG